MKNKGFIYTLVIIIIAGITITLGTSRAIDKSRQQNSSAVVSAQEETVPEAKLKEEGTPELAVAAAGASSAGAVQDRGPAAYVEQAAADHEEAADGSGAEPAAEEADRDSSSAGPGVSASPAEVETVKTVPMSPLEPAMPIDKTREGSDVQSMAKESPVNAVVEDSYYLNRLTELDVQIQKNRENQSASNNYSAKKAAEDELKLWDNELNVIYGEIMKRLDTLKASELVDEEREWMKERDRLAAEAAKASAGGSMESVEYTISLAASTRLRAYELIEIYGYLLKE